MPAHHLSNNHRLDLESRVLAAALKQSVDRDDKNGIVLAYKELSNLLKRQQKIFNQQSKKSSGKQQLASPKEIDQPDSIYKLLGAKPLSTFKDIQTCFWAKIRKLLLACQKNHISPAELQAKLLPIWIARDILHDPTTRADYDLHFLGIRVLDQKQSSDKTQALSNKTPLTVSELVECLNIAKQSELFANNKTIPETEFSQLLIKEEILTSPELDSVLIGQRLIIQGKISVAQFKESLLLTRKKNKSFTQDLTDRGWIQAEDLIEHNESVISAHQYTMPTQLKSIEPKQFNTHNAIPTWSNQLIWEEDIPSNQNLDNTIDQTNSLSKVFLEQKPAETKNKKHKRNS